jgi:hypothetical protein
VVASRYVIQNKSILFQEPDQLARFNEPHTAIPLDFRFLFAILLYGRGNGKQALPAPLPSWLSRAASRLLIAPFIVFALPKHTQPFELLMEQRACAPPQSEVLHSTEPCICLVVIDKSRRNTTIWKLLEARHCLPGAKPFTKFESN